MKPISELHLFPRLTRALYRERYNAEPPPWNRERRIQRWFNPNTPPNPPGDDGYLWFDSAAGEFKTMVVPLAEAVTPNLPGAYSYPKWAVMPTPAVLRGPDGASWPVNPNLLSDRNDALNLARELGLLDSAVRESRMGGPFSYWWNGETRRPWVVDYPRGGGEATSLQVSSLLALRHANGVGMPGHWEHGGGEPVWVSELPGDNGERDARPEIPMPVRPLRSNEKLRRTETPFGVNWFVVEATHMTDRELLEEIHAGVTKLANG